MNAVYVQATEVDCSAKHTQADSLSTLLLHPAKLLEKW